MPLHATDLIELAEAGQSTITIARTQAEGALALAAQARAGQLDLPALLDGLDELFLGHQVVFGPFGQQFERTLLHYSALRLRVNANTARRMKGLRQRRAGTAAPPPDYHPQLTLFTNEATATALAAEQAVSDDEAIFDQKDHQP